MRLLPDGGICHRFYSSDNRCCITDRTCCRGCLTVQVSVQVNVEVRFDIDVPTIKNAFR